MIHNIYDQIKKVQGCKTALVTCCLMLFCLFTSCDKLPEDGDLDGNWQLMSISGYGNTNDYKAQRVFWAFRNGLVQLTDFTSGEVIYSNFTFSYDGKEGQLFLFDFAENCEYTPESNNNEWILFSNKDTLNCLGISPVIGDEIPGKSDYKVKATYKIIELTSKSMQLIDESGQMMVFRKF